MKTNTRTNGNTSDGSTSVRPSDDLSICGDFEHLLEWVCLGAAHSRKDAACAENHRQKLIVRGETKERLSELDSWRQSFAFTEREKAALGLSESISLNGSKELSQETLKDSCRYFDTSEMVRLTLAVLAVNDWIDLHSTTPIRVLVVEDDPLDEELLRHQLKKTSMAENVVFVSNAFQALELLVGPERDLFRRDLVAMFLDIHLQGMSGIELLQHIRSIPGMEDFPVIMLTSSNDPRDMEECQRLKVVRYIAKPISYSSFSNAIANIFHQTKAAKAA